MRVTETNLLVIILVEANCGAVKIQNEVFKPYPEDAVLYIIHSRLIDYHLKVLFSFVLPLDLPLTLSSCAVGVSNFDQTDDRAIIFVGDSQRREHCVGVMVS
jgi:hypothetical protein